MINEVIEILRSNNLHLDLIESIRKTLVEHVKNERHCFSAGKSFSQKKLNNTIPDAEHDRNRKSLENNDQILIQIPKGLTVSSIQIEFHQEKAVLQNRRIIDSF